MDNFGLLGMFSEYKIVFGAVSVLLFLVVFSFLALKFRSQGAKRDTVLIVGLTNAGKSVLFLQLRDGKFRETHTSLIENDETFPLALNSGEKSPVVHVVDIPGHERVRTSKFRQYLPIARGIVFVIDSDNVQVRPIAEFLYDIFTNKLFLKRKIPLLFACNKSDMSTSQDKQEIKSLLEQELDQLRLTRRSIPDQNQQEYQEHEDTLGIEGERFTIAQLENEIDFLSCSAKEREIDGIVNFITHSVR